MALKPNLDPDAWHGPEALPNPMAVPRLGEIYSRTAAFYDAIVAERQAGPKLEALRQLNRQPPERFLEVGAGTGWAFARLIAASGAQDAYAVDLAPGMLAVARRALSNLATTPPGRHSEAVEGPNASDVNPVALPLLLADARRLPFPDARFDCILNTYTLEVLPAEDILAVLDECLRLLKPGGRIAIVNLTDGETPDAVAMTDDWKRRYEQDPEAFGGARPLHLQPLLEAHGYTRVTRTYAGPDWPSEVLLAYRPR